MSDLYHTYTLLQETKSLHLQEVVNEYLNMGYVLIGGVSVIDSGGYFRYIQAVAKPYA